MKKFIFYLIVSLFIALNSYSEIIKNIEVKGNERISKDTIINFSKIDISKDFNQDILNDALKNLYDSNFFDDVSIKVNQSIIFITVDEFPIIQSVNFEGIKSKEQIETLKGEINLREKSPYNKFILEQDLDKILNIFKKSGYYFVDINIEEKMNPNNTIDLTYNINRGDKALIKKIDFIGDKVFKDRKLHNIITSEESKFWKVISKGKFLDAERVELDKRLLKNYYLDRGYYQVEVQNAFSTLLNKESFLLKFKIDAGQKFYFNNFTLNLPTDYEPDLFNKLEIIFNKLKNEPYSLEAVNEILEEIDNIALYANYEFIDANVAEKIVDNNKLDFNFNIIDGDKFYVEKINILGNTITKEEFVRNQIITDEGDPYNKILFNKSINIIKSKRIFSSIKTDIKEGSSKTQKIIDIEVEEQPTGEISAGAGYGSNGSSLSFSVKERNFKGEGTTLQSNVALSEETIRGLVSYSNPNYKYSDRGLTTSFESSVTDRESDFGYKNNLNKFSIGTRYEQFENLYFSPSVDIADETITTTSTASKNYKKQEGSYFDTNFNYGLTYDKRNSPYQPSKGFFNSWSQTIPIVSDTYSLVNSFSTKRYLEIFDQSILTFGFYASSINSLKDQDVRVSQRLFAPRNKLRGFEYGKIGPKDGKDYVGGNYVSTFNVASTVPVLLDSFQNVDLNVFFDAGNVWEVDYSSTVGNSNKIRSSVGTAVDVLTPVGPLSFSITQAMTQATTDVTETFRFQIGTSF